MVRVRRAAVRGLVLLPLGACTPARPALVRLETTQVADSMVLEVVAVGQARVNAAAPPALALEGETVVRFTGAIDPAAPDYFIGPSRVTVPAAPRVRRGTLHASVCPEGERVCRVVSLPVRIAASR